MYPDETQYAGPLRVCFLAFMLETANTLEPQMESIASHLMMGLIGAGIVWFVDRPARRQFRLLMEAIDEGKQEGTDWRFLRDSTGHPTGVRIMYGASAPSDKLGST